MFFFFVYNSLLRINKLANRISEIDIFFITFSITIYFVMNGGWYSTDLWMDDGSDWYDGATELFESRQREGPRFSTVTNRCVPSLLLIVILRIDNGLDLIQLTLQCTRSCVNKLLRKKKTIAITILSSIP